MLIHKRFPSGQSLYVSDGICLFTSTTLWQLDKAIKNPRVIIFADYDYDLEVIMKLSVTAYPQTVTDNVMNFSINQSTQS